MLNFGRECSTPSFFSDGTSSSPWDSYSGILSSPSSTSDGMSSTTVNNFGGACTLLFWSPDRFSPSGNSFEEYIRRLLGFIRSYSIAWHLLWRILVTVFFFLTRYPVIIYKDSCWNKFKASWWCNVSLKPGRYIYDHSYHEHSGQGLTIAGSHPRTLVSWFFRPAGEIHVCRTLQSLRSVQAFESPL